MCTIKGSKGEMCIIKSSKGEMCIIDPRQCLRKEKNYSLIES